MISYLNGKVVLQKANIIIINVGGVGYKVVTPASVLVKNGEVIEVFTYQHIREDSSDLYGFLTYSELELFEKLISVNGVGPKAGLAIMTFAKPERISSAIISEDLSFFQSVPGIGKKAAAKIILDLKSKISGLDGSGAIANSTEDKEIIEALTGLGYKNIEIGRFISKIPTDILGTESKIKWLIRNISK